MGYDFGDGPDTYPTTFASNGPYAALRPGFFLGASIDSESDGQPGASADNDDNTGLDDEDSLTPPTYWYAGEE